MNKNLIYIFVFLVVSLFVISACEQIVGRRINKNNANQEGSSFFIISIEDFVKCEDIYIGEKKTSVHIRCCCDWDDVARKCYAEWSTDCCGNFPIPSGGPVRYPN